MKKVTMRITIEKELIDYVKQEAKLNNMRVSNYLEVLINEYRIKKLEGKSLEQSFERAQQFVNNIKIEDYNVVLSNMMNDTSLKDYGKNIIDKVKQ